MIFDDLSDLFYKLHKKERAKDIARHFGRERKFVNSIENGCGFHLDYSFIAGLKNYGYELRLVKVDNNNIVEELREKARQAQKDMQLSDTEVEASAYGARWLAFVEAADMVRRQRLN